MAVTDITKNIISGKISTIIIKIYEIHIMNVIKVIRIKPNIKLKGLSLIDEHLEDLKI